MGDFNNTTVYQNSYSYMDFDYIFSFFIDCTVIGLGLPLTLLAISALISLVRDDHVAPIFVINLLIADLLQICCINQKMTITFFILDIESWLLLDTLYYFFLMASVGFMMCVALERCLIIYRPLWYRINRSVKVSVLICVIVWLTPVVPFSFAYSNSQTTSIIFVTYLLLPLPVFVFSLVGTLKSLSASISVSSEEKRRIVGAVVLVFLIYVMLFVPIITDWLPDTYYPSLSLVSFILVRLNPIADLVLYFFMGKGATDKLRALLCCCRKETQRPKQQVLTVSGDRTGTVSSM
ncbi:G-protein coupled receptor 4-like [Mastacembelus armatus]|uniref:G-protein coupled receptor 4-like n=1 Tax=Mastacembelus armatus TaxID=205130 RepID=A0A3Q3NCM4_9TELE|nr:G-protein coupled receptor 4-like [Mastacembelus armatus]